MRNLFLGFMMIASFALSAQAIVVHVDSAPNVYGSPEWGPWWTQAKADVVTGTFTDMRTGVHPGTHNIDPLDEIVYSTGDLGKRLHWIYWVPDTTISDLEGNFEVKWVIDWGGTDYTYEGGGWAVDGPETGWSEPSSWEAYAGGVIGSLGFAWWATDDEAPPFNSNSSPYDEADAADVEALRQVVLDYQTYAKGMIRDREPANDTNVVNAEWIMESIQTQVVEPVPSPEPATASLMLMAIAGFAARRR